jgi:DMSO/TMAO reductase YedYZ molybdopterin-dependent catalytic subunit
MSYNEVVNGELVTYDPGTGSEIKINDPLRVILAYEREGKPLPAESDGALRLAVVSPKNNQVTDGHWTVKWVTKLIIKALSRDWTLNLAGKLSEEMDRATFESGATPCCHRRIWTDETGQVWSGIPLWHLVGRVDDDLQHQAGAFNDVLARQGYTIDIVASDGYTLSFDSARVRYNNNLIVANQMNGQPLEDKYFALRLVGSDLQKKEMVGQIEKIVLHLPESAAPSPWTTPLPGPATTVVAPGGFALTIVGEVEKELALKLEDLRSMQVEIKAEHPTEGMQTYQGARISDLLGKAGLKTGVKYMVLVSGDGARTEMPFGLLDKCPDCLVGFSYDGRLTAVMPTMDCYFWVKDLIRIELQ